MECDHCGDSIPTRKSLQRGKAKRPEKCPNCGEKLEKRSTGLDGDLIQK